MRKLKDRPLIQSIIGNALFQILWSGASAIISLYTARSAYIQGLAFHWVVLIGAAIFFLLSAAWYFIDTRRRRQKMETQGESSTTVIKTECPDKWLHEIAERDKHEIEMAVSVVDCKIFENRCASATAHIIFQITIFNGSVYPVSIERNIGGFITYSQRRLIEEITPSQEWKVKNCPRGQAMKIWICQWLNKEEVEFINQIDPNYAYFNFEQLIINIIGGEGFKDITSKPVSFNQIKGVDIRKWR